ncbi:MAG: glycosyltransferase family 4 protein [Bacillota bacterium]
MRGEKGIKVLLITARADIGGGPRHIASLLENKGDGIVFYGAAPDQPPYYPMFLRHCSRCVVLPFRRFSPAAFLRLVRLARKEEIDIIHSHGTGGGIYGRLIRIFYRQGVFIHTFHGIYQRGRGIKKELHLLAERLLGRLTDHFIFVCGSEMQKAEGLGIRRPGSSVVLNGVDTGHYCGLSVDLERKKEELGIRPGSQVIGTVGRLSRPKAPEAGIRAVHRLVKEKRNVVYVMVGDGEERDNVLKEISDLGLEDTVLLLGGREDVGEILKVMDVFVLPSRWEGLPLALLEAMASGLPVVATRVTGSVEVVREGVTGLMVDPDNPDQLSAAISFLLDNPDLRKEMGARGRERAKAHFDHGRMSAETFEVYRRLLKIRRSGRRGVSV